MYRATPGQAGEAVAARCIRHRGTGILPVVHRLEACATGLGGTVVHRLEACATGLGGRVPVRGSAISESFKCEIELPARVGLISAHDWRRACLRRA